MEELKTEQVSRKFPSMERSVKGWVSYLLVGLVAAGATALILVYSNTQLSSAIRDAADQIAAMSEDELPLAEEEGVEAQGKVEEPDIPATWTLVSGDDKDTCSAPTYTGTATVRGWLVYEDNYGAKEWLFHVVPADQKKLPFSRFVEGGVENTTVNESVVLHDIPNNIVQRVRVATPESPVSITVKGYRLYCEGRPILGFEELPPIPPLMDDELLEETE